MERATPVAINTPAALLPCPFCGSADIQHWDAVHFETYCHDCGAAVRQQYKTDEGIALSIASWNRRATTAPVASESRGSVPGGWVLVPHDPNRAMQDAGMDAARLWFGEEIARSGITRSSAIGFFKAMLAAAPTPPAVSNGEPTSGHWMMAFAEQYDRIDDADCTTDFNDLERRARELASSAAAKGEG